MNSIDKEKVVEGLTEIKGSQRAIFALLIVILLVVVITLAVVGRAKTDRAPGGPVPVRFEWYGE